jgi:hypothetical protein
MRGPSEREAEILYFESSVHHHSKDLDVVFGFNGLSLDGERLLF